MKPRTRRSPGAENRGLDNSDAKSTDTPKGTTTRRRAAIKMCRERFRRRRRYVVHIAPAPDVSAARGAGTPCTAYCGFVRVPTVKPAHHVLCPDCVEIANRLTAESRKS